MPAASSRPPLPAPRRAPPPAPPARPGPPDADLAPPQPCGPEEAGLPGAQARPCANPPSHWPPPTRPQVPPAAVEAVPPVAPLAPLHPLRLRRPPPAPAPCAGSLILKPQVDPFLAPIGPPQLQPLVQGTCPFPERVRHRPSGRDCGFIGRLRKDGWTLKGKLNPHSSLRGCRRPLPLSDAEG